MGQDLEAKVAAADRGEAAPPEAAAPAVQPGATPVVEESAQWIAAALRYGAVLRELVPEHARAHWTDERLQRVGAELANCAKHYGWKWGGIFTHPLAQLAGAAAPLVWPIAKPYVMPYVERTLKGKAPALDPGDLPPGAAPPDSTQPHKVAPIA